MKKLFLALSAAMVVVAGCNDGAMKEKEGYIGPATPEIVDGHMTPEVLLSLGRLSDPQLSPDGKMILYGVSYASIAENRSCRNLFISPAAGGDKIQLTRSPKSISCARWDKDGSHIWYLQGGQLWKAPFKAGKLGKAVKMSDIPAGIEEFGFSPDGENILYISQVRSAVEIPSESDPLLDKAKAYATEDLMYRHWDHWMTEINHSFIAPAGQKVTPESSIDILGGPEVKYQLPNGPWGGLEELAWSPNGRYLAYSCKKVEGKEYAFSTDTNIYVYDLKTGKTASLSALTPRGYSTTPFWSPDGEYLFWLQMARDGYEADKVDICRAAIMEDHDCGDGEGEDSGPELVAYNPAELTWEFPYNAAGPIFSPDGNWIYFNALYKEGVQGIFRVDINGDKVEGPLTGFYETADFGSPFGFREDGTLLATFSSMDFPTELVAVNPDAKTVEKITSENDAILSQLDPIRHEKRMIETVDGQQMLTWVLYPPKFDPSKVYPAIEITLGGPQGTLSEDWSYRWNYRLMASQGYIVILPNRRGTTAFGQEWCEEISGDYIGLNMQDYLSAAKALKAEPYVGKIAACGASYGGYSVYYLAGIHGDIYDCFIAHAGIFNEEHMYMTTEEMWFPNWDNGGIPYEYAYDEGETGARGDGITFGGIQQAGSPWSDKPEAVRHYANSPHKLVKNWHTPILCIHGGNDFRVPYDEAMAAFNAAQMMGVPSRLIVFPDENHWILQPQNALYWHRSYFSWLDRWLKD